MRRREFICWAGRLSDPVYGREFPISRQALAAGALAHFADDAWSERGPLPFPTGLAEARDY